MIGGARGPAGGWLAGKRQAACGLNGYGHDQSQTSTASSGCCARLISLAEEAHAGCALAAASMLMSGSGRLATAPTPPHGHGALTIPQHTALRWEYGSSRLCVGGWQPCCPVNAKLMPMCADSLAKCVSKRGILCVWVEAYLKGTNICYMYMGRCAPAAARRRE
jgi:hypothetical protein